MSRDTHIKTAVPWVPSSRASARQHREGVVGYHHRPTTLVERTKHRTSVLARVQENGRRLVLQCTRLFHPTLEWMTTGKRQETRDKRHHQEQCARCMLAHLGIVAHSTLASHVHAVAPVFFTTHLHHRRFIFFSSSPPRILFSPPKLRMLYLVLLTPGFCPFPVYIAGVRDVFQTGSLVVLRAILEEARQPNCGAAQPNEQHDDTKVEVENVGFNAGTNITTACAGGWHAPSNVACTSEDCNEQRGARLQTLEGGVCDVPMPSSTHGQKVDRCASPPTFRPQLWQHNHEREGNCNAVVERRSFAFAV